MRWQCKFYIFGWTDVMNVEGARLPADETVRAGVFAIFYGLPIRLVKGESRG